MATAKFITVKGAESIGDEPFYQGVLQHDRSMTLRETYQYCAEHTGYKPTAIRAVFMAIAEVIRENQRKGNISVVDGVASIRNYARGAFESLVGPWNKGKNRLIVQAVELDPFKSSIAAVTLKNTTEGAKPFINTVFDETTLEYDEITGTDVFSIAGVDLAPDAEKADEYVALVSSQGVETKCAIEFSDLQNVKARLEAALPAGVYTLKVYTRSGLGDDYGVNVATRKVSVA